MYYLEHDPPHLHAEYQGMVATFDFSGKLLNGNFRSPTASKLVKKWIKNHEMDLIDNWNRAGKHEPLKLIEPLL
jgi:hypothetical protein